MTPEEENIYYYCSTKWQSDRVSMCATGGSGEKQRGIYGAGEPEECLGGWEDGTQCEHGYWGSGSGHLNMGFWGTLHPDMRVKVQELGVVVGGRKGRLL